MIVTLTPEDMAWTKRIALLRQQQAQAEGRQNAHGFAADDEASELALHLLGCQGKLAAAKAYKVEWPAHVGEYRFRRGRRGKPDLPPDREVKTRSRSDYELLVRKDDDEAREYILVFGRAGVPRMDVKGSKRGRDAMRTEWLQAHGDREPAYFVPQANLDPVPGADRATPCPVCHGPYYTMELVGTRLHVCANGCTGRRIACAIGQGKLWP